MATQWPAVKRAIVDLLPTLTGWPSADLTFDGPPVAGDSSSYVTVGYVDGEDSAGSFTTDTTNGYRIEETGSVVGELVAWAGDTDLPARQAEAFAAMDAFEVALRADRTLGVLSPDGTARLSVDVLPAQTNAGAVQRLRFTIEYLTRT